MRNSQNQTASKSDGGQSVAGYTAVKSLSAIHGCARMFILSVALASIGLIVCSCNTDRSQAETLIQEPVSEAPAEPTERSSSEIQLIGYLRDLSESPLMPGEVKDRARRALQRLENGNLDRAPILVLAYVDRNRIPQSNVATLHLVVVDEDLDLRGLAVKEEGRDPNGTLFSLEERYDVYADSFVAPPIGTFFGEETIPVRIRRTGERKDEHAWTEYVAYALDDVIRRHTIPEVLDVSAGTLRLVKQREPAGSTIDAAVSFQGQPESAMPEVWISLPAPHKRQVLIYVYDRAGNRSDTIPVHDWTLQAD